ncbi:MULTISPECIES: AAA family ATPase [Actinomycetes]|uniref:AAA family ATPase n=1 Tax=Micromonospora sp. NPDC005367 TaxID=3155590 RepID=UPI0033A62451
MISEDRKYDGTAEISLLGAMMHNAEAVRDSFLSVRSDDWHPHPNATIATLMREMLAEDIAIEPGTVEGYARKQGLVPHRISPIYLLGLFERAGMPGSASFHAERIRGLGAARRLEGEAEYIMQRINSSFANGTAIDDASSHIAALRARLDDLEAANIDTIDKIGLTLGEVLALESHRQWIVPGLLAHMDRVILTAAEGGGKSTLMTQIAAALCGGIHPFTGLPLTECGLDAPPRVLVLDFENSELQLQSRCRMILPMVNECRANRGLPPVDLDNTDHVLFVNRPEGVDLAGKSADADLNWIESKLSRFNPGVLIMGPIYRMHAHESSNEEAARKVTVAIDRLRARYRFALLTEAHSAKATTTDGRRNMAPIGTSLWLRWPEFGLGLLRATDDPNKGPAEYVDVVRWRGEREKRLWPKALQRSAKLPWTPRDADYFAEERHFRETGEMPL